MNVTGFMCEMRLVFILAKEINPKVETRISVSHFNPVLHLCELHLISTNPIFCLLSLTFSREVGTA